MERKAREARKKLVRTLRFFAVFACSAFNVVFIGTDSAWTRH
jgi:hypothetical protein